MSSVHRIPRSGLLKHSKRKSIISSSRCAHNLRPSVKTSSKLKKDEEQKKRATFLSIDNDMSDFEGLSDSGSFRAVLSNWKKSRSSASSKRIDHSSIDHSSDEDRTIWTETSSLDSKESNGETSGTTTTKKEAAMNTTKSFLRRYHKKIGVNRRKSPPIGDGSEPNYNGAHGTTNSNVVHTHCHNGNAGDTKVLTVETITAEMERLKDMAQMMSEMNKRLSGENEAMMELMRSVQPRAKELMHQLRQERKEAHDLKVVSNRSFKDHAILKSELNKLRVDLIAEKEKFNKLKTQVIQLRSQYILKVSKLQQLKKNTKRLIERYREFKDAHSVCGEEREMLRTKLIEVVSKFDKLKSIASQFQEGGSIPTKLREVQHEKAILQDEKARLEARLREHENLELRMKKMEADAKSMAAEYENDLERMRSLLEEKEELLVRLEKDQSSMRSENAELSRNVKRLTVEHQEIKGLLESKDVELEDTRGRLSQQDENIRRLQDAYVQLTTKLSESRCNSNAANATKQYKSHGTNTPGESPETNKISKDVMGRFESAINDVTDHTYSLRKGREEEDETSKKHNANGASRKKDVCRDIEERRTTRKVFRSSPVYESKSPGHSMKHQKSISVMKQFDEETQTENSRRVELIQVSPPSEEKKSSSTHRFRTVSRPVTKDRSYKFMPLPRTVTKNNNACFRYAQGRQRIWRLCRSHDPVFQNMVPSRCAILDNQDPIKFKLKTNPTEEGTALYGKLENVFDAIRAQEDGIERLKSQLDIICEKSQIEDCSSEEDSEEEDL